ncbi:hypothetical protein AALP_AA2G048900 [Arabis alpina]|uniref:Uncharacterized protein n=1 Tax=Arabis alpina TaxID=50452 RepID=A0A087HFE1_ARAAL|nr:hypothetical protein AALP_AA2G048900 [Arabis alpina]
MTSMFPSLNLSPGRADVSPSSSSSDLQDSSDDEVVVDEVEQTKKAAPTRVRPDPLGSSLSKKDSLQRLRQRCKILEDIELVVPSSVDRAYAPPPGYMTLFENYFDKCSLWFPLPWFLMRFLATHGACLAQINPRGIRHLLGIYVLSRECSVDIGTDHLPYLTDFRVRGQSDELKHNVTHASRMAVIAGEVSASRVAAPPASGLLRDEAYVETKSKASERSLLFDQLVSDYDEDVHLKDNELCAAKEANGVQQSRLDELTDQNLVLECDAFSVQKIKKDYDTKLAKLQSRCTKGDEEIASLKTQLSFAGDVQSVRISKAVTEARDEMTGGFSAVREVLEIPEACATIVEMAVDDEAGDETDQEF